MCLHVCVCVCVCVWEGGPLFQHNSYMCLCVCLRVCVCMCVCVCSVRFEHDNSYMCLCVCGDWLLKQNSSYLDKEGRQPGKFCCIAF